MSSSADNKALAAENTQLKAERNFMEDEIEALRSKVKKLEVAKHISAMKPEVPTTQPSLSEGSSDPTLRAEISKLRGEIAAKDVKIGKLEAKVSDMIKGMSSAQEMSSQALSMSKRLTDHLKHKLDAHADSDLRESQKGRTHVESPVSNAAISVLAKAMTDSTNSKRAAPYDATSAFDHTEGDRRTKFPRITGEPISTRLDRGAEHGIQIGGHKARGNHRGAQQARGGLRGRGGRPR